MVDNRRHTVLVVEPWALGNAEEKLAAVGVGSSVCHGEDAWRVVAVSEGLVFKRLPVDAFTAGPVPWVSSCSSWFKW